MKGGSLNASCSGPGRMGWGPPSDGSRQRGGRRRSASSACRQSWWCAPPFHSAIRPGRRGVENASRSTNSFTRSATPAPEGDLMTAAIRTLGLSKDYGRARGLFDLDLEVEEGEVLGYLGP